MWKLPPELEDDVSQLFSAMRRPKLLSGSRTACKIIEDLAAYNEPAVIPVIVTGLFSHSKAVHKAASSSINRLLQRVPSIELLRLSERLDSYSYRYISDRWNNLRPKEVRSFLANSKDVAAASLVSFHHNGYVRHEAIKFLATTDSGRELPFLIIRQNDWVDSISEDSQEFVSCKLNDEYLKHFVGNADLLIHLLTYKRRNLSGIVSRFVGLLAKPKHKQLLLEAFQSSEDKTLRILARELLLLEGDHRQTVIRFGVDSDDGVMRLQCIREVYESLPVDECMSIATRLVFDGYIPVRREAYILKIMLMPNSEEEIWKECLFDKNKSLRELARFSLKPFNCDVASIYRQKLSEADSSLPALSGLVENGDQSDLPVFRRYLDSPLASRRAEAIRGIGRAGGEAEILNLRQYLLDQSPRVVRETHRQLQAVSWQLMPDELFQMMLDGKYESGKRIILWMLFDLGRWRGLAYMIRAAANPDLATTECSKGFLARWFSSSSYNRVFTQPSTKQKSEIQAAIDDSKSKFDKGFLSDLGFWLSCYGFDIC